MSSEFFNKFPVVNYNGIPLYNITWRIILDATYALDTSAYLSYTLMYEQLPEILANDYYQDPGLYWLVQDANGIIDPYFDWYIPSDILEDLIVDQYGDDQQANSIVVNYTRQANSVSDPYGGICINNQTYSQNLNSNSIFNPQTVFNLLQTDNDNKRTVYLINEQYAPEIIASLNNITG